MSVDAIPRQGATRGGRAFDGAPDRVYAMFLRYLTLHRRNLIRAFDIVFWPVVDLLVWGYVSLFIQQQAAGPVAQMIVFLIGALIGWDIHYRGQQAVTISFMEEIWTRNIVNVLIAPLRLWEWVAATCVYGALKVAVVTVLLALIARGLYAFDVVTIGWTALPLAAALLWFGWAVGLLTTGLLLRFGHAAEALLWGIPFLLQPFSCVFYPLSVLPPWAQIIARMLPTTYVFESLREALQGAPVSAEHWLWIAGLNVLYTAAGAVSLGRMMESARRQGRLGRLGQD